VLPGSSCLHLQAARPPRTLPLSSPLQLLMRKPTLRLILRVTTGSGGLRLPNSHVTLVHVLRDSIVDRLARTIRLTLQFEATMNMRTRTASPRNSFGKLETTLESQRNELRSRIHRHRMDVVVEREPDDEGAQAYDNIAKDMLVVTLERERRTLQEIESALVRIKKGEYGTCASCCSEIPKARLDALPWTRVCVSCAEQNSKGLYGGSRQAAV